MYNKVFKLIIAGLILATAIEHQPKNRLERIIKDADLDYLGRNDFKEISNKLFDELVYKGFLEDKKQWDELQVQFFEHHRYFTNFSKEHRMPKKKENKPQLG